MTETLEKMAKEIELFRNDLNTMESLMSKICSFCEKESAQKRQYWEQTLEVKYVLSFFYEGLITFASKEDIQNAGNSWCRGQFEKVFLSDKAYFRENWKTQPELVNFVLSEMRKNNPALDAGLAILEKSKERD